MWFSRYFKRERRRPISLSNYLAINGSPELAAGDSHDDEKAPTKTRSESPSSYSLRATPQMSSGSSAWSSPSRLSRLPFSHLSL